MTWLLEDVLFSVDVMALLFRCDV